MALPSSQRGPETPPHARRHGPAKFQLPQASGLNAPYREGMVQPPPSPGPQAKTPPHTPTHGPAELCLPIRTARPEAPYREGMVQPLPAPSPEAEAPPHARRFCPTELSLLTGPGTRPHAARAWSSLHPGPVQQPKFRPMPRGHGPAEFSQPSHAAELQAPYREGMVQSVPRPSPKAALAIACPSISISCDNRCSGAPPSVFDRQAQSPMPRGQGPARRQAPSGHAGAPPYL